MHSDAAYACIEAIANVNGKQKEAELRRQLSLDKDNTLKQVLKYALDPQVTFGISPERLPKMTGGQEQFHHLATFSLLFQLATRELTGGEAQKACIDMLNLLTPESGTLFRRILGKDLRCGMGESTVNKVLPGLLSEFNVMLAAPYDEAKLRFPVRLEPKYDGMRVVAIWRKAVGFQFFTRSGKAVTSISEEAERSLLMLKGAIHDEYDVGDALMLDGELMGDSFKETMEQARRKDSTFDNGRFHVFDWLPGERFDALKKEFKKGLGYADRRSILERAFESAKQDGGLPGLVLPTSYIVNSSEEIQEYYRNARARGLEGLIIKAIDGLYHPRRHVDWMKVKAEESLDLPIVDVEEGTGKYEGMLGAFIVDHKGVRVRVGSGFSDAERGSYWKQWHSERHALEGQMIEVEFQEETPDGSLRHPRYVRLRNDKQGLF